MYTFGWVLITDLLLGHVGPISTPWWLKIVVPFSAKLISQSSSNFLGECSELIPLSAILVQFRPFSCQKNEWRPTADLVPTSYNLSSPAASLVLCVIKHLRHRLVNTLRSRQDGRHFPDDIFKCIFLNENASTAIKISLKFVPKGPFNNIPALVQIMAWRRLGDKPLSESMMVILLTHICVTRPQWVNT